MVKITCVFRRTTEGRLALSFAADLLQKVVKGDTGILHVHLAPAERDAQAISSEKLPVERLLAEQEKLVLNEVSLQTGLPAARIVFAAISEDCLVVDHPRAFDRADLDVLYPSRERTLLARGTGPLLVPFGDSISALGATSIALQLASSMSLPVVFYHTTWKDETITSDRAEDHMCTGARETAERLKNAAIAAGVRFSFVLEMADDVAEGVLQCALRLSVRLIVMPRSAKTTLGCYVNQALAKTPVPLLAVASRSGRGL